MFHFPVGGGMNMTSTLRSHSRPPTAIAQSITIAVLGPEMPHSILRHIATSTVWAPSSRPALAHHCTPFDTTRASARDRRSSPPHSLHAINTASSLSTEDGVGYEDPLDQFLSGDAGGPWFSFQRSTCRPRSCIGPIVPIRQFLSIVWVVPLASRS